MIIELIRKEFIGHRTTSSSSKAMKALRLFLKLIFIAAFVALEVFTFKSLDQKISHYSSYGTYDFLVLYLFVVMLIGIVSSLIQARKVFFNNDDNRILLPLPLSSETVVISKTIYCYIYAVFTSLILTTPILFTYGIGRVEYAFYYVFTFLYPVFISVFQIGIVLIFVALVELIYKLLKLSDLVQFLLACVGVIGLCFAYQFLLNMFLTALSDSSVGGLFSKDFVEGLHKATLFLVPVNNIIDAILNNSGHIMANIFIFLGVDLIILVIGFGIANYFYQLFINKSFEPKINNAKEKEMKVISPFKALMRKEFMMLFKNSAYTFSYTSLLIMAPFLSFVVISSLNAIIYQNLEFFSVYFPELVNGLNLTLILLFLTVINSSAALSMSREGKQIQIVKYLPVSPMKQIMAKLITPMGLSFISLLVTLVTLIATKSITPVVFGVSLVIGSILLFADNVLSIEWDMHDKSIANMKMAPLNTVLALGFPLLILFTHFLLSFVHCPGYAIYLIEVLLAILLLLPCFIKIKSRFTKAFKKMEVN